MPSHRDRSASPSRSKHRSRKDRDRDRDDEDSRDRRRDRDRDRDRERERERERDEPRERREGGDYPANLEEVGVKEISEEDYFLKAAEFRFWLREEKGKYIDELSGESSRKYFKKFVKRWNSLDLSRQFYRAQTSTAAPSASQTAYKWGFVTNRSKVDRDQLARAREDVDRLTNGGVAGADQVKRVLGPALPSASGSRTIGPTLPPSTMFSANHTDRQLALEDAASASSAARKADRNKAYERVEELVPRATGREGRIEEKRAKNALSKDAGEAEVPDSVLMGDDGGFQAAIARRDAAAAKRMDRKAQATADRRAMAGERFSEIKSKDAATMEMFKQMAKSRFG